MLGKESKLEFGRKRDLLAGPEADRPFLLDHVPGQMGIPSAEILTSVFREFSKRGT